MPDLSNHNIEHTFKYEFQINNDYVFSMSMPHAMFAAPARIYKEKRRNTGFRNSPLSVLKVHHTEIRNGGYRRIEAIIL